MKFHIFRVNLRVEHVSPSKCREEFVARVKKNDELRREAKKNGEKLKLKREPQGPRPSHKINVTENKPEFLTPLPYEFIA